jgi:hypothetical protein
MLAKLGEQWGLIDVIPLGLGFGPNIVVSEKAATMDHRLNAALVVLA